MKTFQQLYEDLLRQKVSVEEPLPKEYDPKHLDCLLYPEEYMRRLFRESMPEKLHI